MTTALGPDRNPMCRLALAVVFLLAAGCTRPPAPAAAPPPVRLAPDTLPSERYVVVFSSLAIRVHPDGPLARLGHPHLICSGELTGVIELREPATATGFALTLPSGSLAVDDPVECARVGAGVPAEVPAAAREGTRRNLLGPALLDAGRHPELRLASAGLSGGPEQFTAQVQVSVHGTPHLVSVPVEVAFRGDRLTAAGRFALSHGDLGLTPFAVALGALRVADMIDIEFRLEAQRGDSA